MTDTSAKTAERLRAAAEVARDLQATIGNACACAGLKMKLRLSTLDAMCDFDPADIIREVEELARRIELEIEVTDSAAEAA